MRRTVDSSALSLPVRYLATLGLTTILAATPAIGGPPAQSSTITYQIQVYEIKAIDDLEGRFMGDPDFELEVEMGPRKFVQKKSGNPIRPNWTFRVQSPATELKVRLLLWEADYPSDAEHCDINSIKGELDLSLMLPNTGSTFSRPSTVSSPGIFKYSFNRAIVVRGGGDRHRCEIRFRVTRTGAGL